VPMDQGCVSGSLEGRVLNVHVYWKFLFDTLTHGIMRAPQMLVFGREDDDEKEQAKGKRWLQSSLEVVKFAEVHLGTIVQVGFDHHHHNPSTSGAWPGRRW